MSTDKTDTRITRTREKVIQATIVFLSDEGPGELTHQRIAKYAGVGRATVYRHWPKIDELLFEALARIMEGITVEGAGRLSDELAAEVKRRRHELNRPLVASSFATIIALAPHDAQADALRQRLVSNIVSSLQLSIDKGVAKGQLRPGLDAKVLTAKVMGAMIWASFVQREVVPESLIDLIVKDALKDWELPPSSR